jgi:hypothetical protein
VSAFHRETKRASSARGPAAIERAVSPSENARMTLSIVGGDRGWKILRQEAQIIEIMCVTAI